MTSTFTKNLTKAAAETRARLAMIAAASEEAREALEEQRLADAKDRRSQPGSLEQRYLRAKGELLCVTADYARAHGIDVSAARKELEAIVAEADQHT